MLSPDLVQKNNFNFHTKAYIASGFFNPEQLSIVSSIEDMLDEAEVEYYSPRKCGLNIMSNNKLDDKDLEFSFKRSLCNFNNLRIMDEVNLGIVNLCGKEDIGTLFEYGYMLESMIMSGLTKVITLSDKKIFNLEVTEVIDKYGKLCQEYYKENKSRDVLSEGNYFTPRLKIFKCDSEKDSSDIDSLIRMIHELDNFGYGMYNRYVVDLTDSIHWRSGIVMLGYICRYLSSSPKLKRVSFISPFISKSNLMLTESLIQYKNMSDFNNDIPVKYNPEDIR